MSCVLCAAHTEGVPEGPFDARPCSACMNRITDAVRFVAGMTIGWADSWRQASGVDPNDPSDPRPDPNDPRYVVSTIGFDLLRFTCDMRHWQGRAFRRAIERTRAAGKDDGHAPGPADVAIDPGKIDPRGGHGLN